MALRYRIFRKPIIASESTIVAITKATVVLHNFIKKSDTETDTGNHIVTHII